jgi:hypothetical protein
MAATMQTKRKKICEVLVSTVIVAVMPVTLYWTWTIIRNWHGPFELGRLVLGFLGGIFFGLLTVGVYIVPSAFLVSLVIVYSKRCSLRVLALLLFVTLICSSVSCYLMDPTQSRSKHGSAGYFTRFDWFASRANLICILTGFVASLIAFWAVQRCRKRYETLA